MEQNIFIDAFNYIVKRYDLLLSALGVQFYLVMLASLITVAVGVPLGVALTRLKLIKGFVLKVTGVLYTIPILAMFGLLIPLFGIGNRSALIALTIYGLLPVLQNTYVGIKEVSPAVKEAARGMGASNLQLLMRVELPLALPVILAGIRTSVVMNISVATFAVFIGAGGMGTVIMQGIRTYHNGMLIAGTLLVALTAVIAERLLGYIEARIARTLK